MSALKTSSEKIFGPPTLESCAMAAIHFNNVETGDFLTPMLQKEVDAFRMLEGEFKVTKIDVEVKRVDEIEVTSQMVQFGQAHFAKSFPLKLDEIVEVEKTEDYWEVKRGGVWIFDIFLVPFSYRTNPGNIQLPGADLEVLVVESVEGGRVVRQDLLRWRKEGGKVFRCFSLNILNIITLIFEVAVSQRMRELWVGADGGLVWRNTIPVVFNKNKNNNSNNDNSFIELTITCTYRAARVKT